MKRIEREEEKENIWRDKRNIKGDQLLSLKFFWRTLDGAPDM